MSNPLTSNQHGYVKRALHAFETVAEALERIADSLEASTESKAGADTEADTKAEAHRTKIEPSEHKRASRRGVVATDDRGKAGDHEETA